MAFVFYCGCTRNAERPANVPNVQPAQAVEVDEPKPNMAVTPESFRRLRFGMSEQEI
jgi:hypothetical protein